MDQFVLQDKIRGSLVGGAAGDALGYAIEFQGERSIFSHYGKNGITQYQIDDQREKALISDDTQMTLFTAVGLLFGETRLCMRGIGGIPHDYIKYTYLDWLTTQETSFQKGTVLERYHEGWSWLLDVPELYSRRAPGMTCISSLNALRRDHHVPENNSKGCGGVMRVAPLGLHTYYRIEEADKEGAEVAALTHGHSLGYMPAAVLVHVINRMVYTDMTLEQAVLEARETVESLYCNDDHISELTEIIDRAVQLSKNEDDDLNNIHRLGEGWVGEEALAIAIYCSLRHEHDFSGGIIAAVNHRGDSDSTGAITGNILGAINGYQNMDTKWKKQLELLDVILEVADDLAQGVPINEYDPHKDEAWYQKYVNLHIFTGMTEGENEESRRPKIQSDMANLKFIRRPRKVTEEDEQ